MLFEQVLKILVGIFIGIFVARYLGVESFGTYSYIVVVATIAYAVGRMGFDNILVREISNNENSKQEYFSTVAVILSFSYLGASLVIGFYGLCCGGDELQFLFLIAALGAFFQLFLVIDYWFQGQVKSKYSSIAKSLGLLFSGVVKLTLIYLNAEILYFVISFVVDQAIIALLLFSIAKKQGLRSFYGGFNKELVKPLLKGATPLMFAALAFSLYAKVDQIMIHHFLGSYQLGLYASAAKIYEGIMILPYVLMLSLIPLLTKLKNSLGGQAYLYKVGLMFRYLLLTMFILACLINYFSYQLMSLTFGADYIEASSVLSILIWATLITSIGTITARVMMVEKMEKKLLKLTMVGLFSNILLNLYLIPKYGISGAAYSTIISMFLAYVMFDYFDSKLIFLAKTKQYALGLRKTI